MARGRIGTQRQLGPSGDPAEGSRPPVPTQARMQLPSAAVAMEEHQADFRFDPSQPSRRFEPDAASVVRGTPVGGAGVKSYHRFPDRMLFVVDDERKAVPPPNITQAPRRSLFQQFQRNHYQFHINPDWGRKNGQYPRFSFINIIQRTAQDEAALRKAAGEGTLYGTGVQRPRPRFTKVLRYPRQDATPGTYGRYGE